VSSLAEYSVSFSGSVTVSSIADAHAALVAAVNNGGPVVVNLDDIVEADLTLAQLLEAARLTAAERGQAIRLENPAEGAVLQVLQRGGFLDPHDTDRVNFWFGGKTQS